uniref:TIL domain-containing protein n=1 Tax=Steinernema glaseri TaxID=37863 RepID=A0A1I8A2H2_9BILA
MCPSKHTCVNGTCVDTIAPTNCPVVNLALAPEGCSYAEDINEIGCIVPKLVCKDLKCKENEEVKLCGACDPTCEKPICASSLLCKQPECGCIDGFVRNKSGLCINATECLHHPVITDHHPNGVAKAVHPKCGLNEELKACGSACAPTCTVPEPVCESHCIIDVCQCKEGYVAFTNGSCIALSDCPEVHKNVTQCAPHETFTNCGSACEPTCENPEPTVCTLQCVVDVCQCEKGYVRNSAGKCITKDNCLAPPAIIEANQVCGPNEHFTVCGAECEPTCSEPFPAFCSDHCVQDVCQCAPGFVRDTNNKCVRFSECQEVDDSSCGRFEKFQSCGTACEPTCDNPEPKDCTQQCLLDVCQCRAGYVRNDKGKCVKKAHCPKKEAPKQERICGLHERFQTCGSACEPTCENPKPAFCTEQCIVDVCQCEAGFVRHVSGLCVTPGQC